MAIYNNKILKANQIYKKIVIILKTHKTQFKINYTFLNLPLEAQIKDLKNKLIMHNFKLRRICYQEDRWLLLKDFKFRNRDKI